MAYEPVVDKGQCIVELTALPNKGSKTGFVAILQVDCRTCGADGPAPAVVRK